MSKKPALKVVGGRSRFSKEAVARRLYLLRAMVSHIENKKITQTDFARRAGLTQSGYTHYENGMRLPSIAAAAALVDSYDVSLDWIFLGRDLNLELPLLQALKQVLAKEAKGEL